MQIRLLGPFEVVDAARPISLAGPKERTVLAVLTVNASQVVSEARLSEALWGEDWPATATKTLQNYIRRLRRALEGIPEIGIETTSQGYRLRVDEHASDVAEVEGLRTRAGRAAKEGEYATAAVLLRQASSLFRGEPLAEFLPAPFAAGVAARLTELRETVVEERIDADLAAGHHAEVVGELQDLVEKSPLRERRWAQLIVALYRCGRQAEALRAYHRARQTLVDELGIEPGPDLRRLETAVLAQDPSLDLPAPSVSAEAPELPSGTVTFCFTDIEGSTRLMRRLGDRYAELSERHVTLMRQAWQGHRGYDFGATGDSVFVAFQDATDAVHACVVAQQLLAAEDWPDDAVVRVRMGIHSGIAFPREGNYVALAVNQTVRIMSAAHGGQVLVSSDTVNRLAATRDVAIVPVGRYRIRDFDEPVQLFELSTPRIGVGFPAVRAVPADGHNLITPATPLIGRDNELAELEPLLQPGELVTLAGPGGVGKTRLANELGRLVATRWPDGVWMVDLAPVHDASLIGPAVGEAVGAPTRAGDRWRDVLDHLQERSALVLWDNCEHLRDACATAIEQLFASCPRCGGLATSREPLGLDRELVFRVPPLALPSPDVTTARDALVSPAVQLFVERARAARRGMPVDDPTVPTVVEICRRLDGLPLALELAAARLSALQPAELLRGLRDRFRLLRASKPTIPERQRTMEGLLEWSERLLTAAEQTCLRRLSVFRGNFSLDAAGVAAGFEDLAADDVPALLWSLVDKSLALADTSMTATRYRLLESVREFAARRLDDRGETNQTAERVAAWYLEKIGPAVRHVRGWTSDVEVELDNLRALIPMLSSTAPEDGQRIAFTIARYLDAIQAYQDGIEELTRYVKELAEPTPTRVSLYTTLGDLQLRLGNVTAATEALSEAEGLRKQVGALPEWDDVAIERTRGEIALRSGDNAAAVELARLMLGRDISVRGRARMSSQLGIAALALGDLGAAREAFEQELSAYQELGDEVFETSSEGNLAEVALRRGDLTAAAAHQRASLTLALQLGMSVMVAYSLIVAARIVASRKDWTTAAGLHAHAELILDKTGIALYADDQRASDEMLAAARLHLGDQQFAAARSVGLSSDLPAIATLADRVLAEAASVLAQSASAPTDSTPE